MNATEKHCFKNLTKSTILIQPLTVFVLFTVRKIKRWSHLSKGSNLWPFCWLAYLQLIYEPVHRQGRHMYKLLTRRDTSMQEALETSEIRAHPWIPCIFWVVEKQSSLLATFYSGDSCVQNLVLPFYWRSRIVTVCLVPFISRDTLFEYGRSIRFDSCLFFAD